MCLHPLLSPAAPPERFTYPFCYEPHPLAVAAAEEVKRHLLTLQPDEGKMFGVLVVEAPDGMAVAAAQQASERPRLAFLAAYSGLLMGRNDWPWFVPPVFDAQQPDGHFKQTECAISDINRQIRLLEASAADAGGSTPAAQTVDALKARRRQMSEELQLWLFRQYRFLNGLGQEKDLVGVWQDYHCSPRIRNKYPLPPGGTGDCCAPKLLQYAYRHNLRPVCMAEFWWGPSPAADVRHHGQYYPACRGKCKPVLTWMLKGLSVDPDPETLGFPPLGIETVYEDDSVIVVNKPSGLLSVPGRIEHHSVATILAARCPGSLLAHRLDMGTSGLMVAAKTIDAYHNLQQQFVRRTVDKQYVALLDGIPAAVGEAGLPGVGASSSAPLPSGTIRLPLLADVLNRPRQVVDYERGKTAVTDYRVLSVSAGRTRVALIPHTGRTHQLRLHCAHPDGLGCPIVGDELYGTVPAPSVTPQRLLLHAERIRFTHPDTGQTMLFICPPEF